MKSNNSYVSPLNWFGGKYYMATNIVPYFIPHKIYVEIFGGGGHLLFLKPHSSVEVYNDINSSLVNFFRVIRNQDTCDELIRRMQLTPYSREEYEQCLKIENSDDDIEKARKFMTTVLQSMNSTGKGSWAVSKISRRGIAHKTSFYLRKIDEHLPNAIERLRSVLIENMDFRKIIKKYDGKETLFYLDPPYIDFTRVSPDIYTHEMTIKDHKDMVDMLLEIEGKVILSGYDNYIYKKLTLNGWYKRKLGDYSKRSSTKKRDTGYEVVWTNYDPDRYNPNKFFIKKIRKHDGIKRFESLQ